MKHIAHFPRRPRAAGFTLIEIMITVAIVAIIASIALPQYTSYVARARRADARTQLLQAAQFMQRFYAANDQYGKTRDGSKDTKDFMPPNLMRSPTEGTALYEMKFPPSVAGDTTFSLVMSPVAGTSMASDACGAFTINQSGLKGVTGTKSVADCWK